MTLGCTRTISSRLCNIAFKVRNHWSRVDILLHVQTCWFQLWGQQESGCLWGVPPRCGCSTRSRSSDPSKCVFGSRQWAGDHSRPQQNRSARCGIYHYESGTIFSKICGLLSSLSVQHAREDASKYIIGCVCFLLANSMQVLSQSVWSERLKRWSALIAAMPSWSLQSRWIWKSLQGCWDN